MAVQNETLTVIGLLRMHQTTNDILKAHPLPEETTSQKAELTVLTRDLHLATENGLTSILDSKYAFLIVHSHSAIWREGIPHHQWITRPNAPLIAKLLEAISQPTQVAILHYKGHQTQLTTRFPRATIRLTRVAGQIAFTTGASTYTISQDLPYT